MGRRKGVRVTLPYIQEFKDRQGRVRRYFRHPELPRVPLPGHPGSPEFMLAYNAALAGHRIEPKSINRSAPGSVSGTIAAYYTDNSFLGLAPGTRQGRREILERFRNEAGELPVALMEQKHVAQRLGKMKPFAARNWLKAIRALMQFAKRIGLREDDPTERIEMNRAKAGAIHTWTEDEIAIFELHHGLGTRARLAMAILLYTAARRGDAVKLGPQHIRSGRLVYRQQKTGRALEIPIHPQLAEALAATPSQHLTFLVTTQGGPYTPKGFGKLFRRWCIEAGLPQCSPHGLRKACARRLAEAGCSAHEIASITGHKTLSEVQRYTDAANQANLAKAAFDRAGSRTAIVKRSEQV